MRRLLLPLLLVLAAVTASAKPLQLPRVSDDWVTLRVDELEIFSSASPSATKAIAQDLVRMREAVGQLTRLRVRSPLPLKVFIFPNERSFAPYRDALLHRRAEQVSGMFLAHELGHFIMLDASSQAGVDRVVFHELSHYFVGNTIEDLPLWLNEGVAEYYSTFRTSGDAVDIGRPIADHVNWLRNEQLIPLGELFAVDRHSPIYNEGDRTGVFYAQSWALFHYLMIGNPERRPQLTTFLAQLGARKPVAEAFDKAFGVTYAQMEQELRQYVRKRAFHFRKYKLGELSAAAVPPPLPLLRDDLLYELGHLFMYAGPEHEETATSFLSEALRINDAHAGAHADVGRIHDHAGRTAEAEAAFQRALDHGSSDPEIYLLRGRSLLERQEMLKARKLFERSVQLDPESARAWAGLGATYITTNDDPAPGLNALETSLRLAPNNEEALFYLKQLRARAEAR